MKWPPLTSRLVPVHAMDKSEAKNTTEPQICSESGM